MSHELDSDLGFSSEAITACLAREGLLSLELEFTRACDLRCTYCYALAGEPLTDELTLEELLSVVKQAKQLGAERIILLGGGEPLLFPGLTDVVRHIQGLGLSQALFTNGMRLNPEMCRFLYDHRVTVAVKHNSLMPAVQDELAGMKGAHARIHRGLRLLMEAGYPDADHSLCIQSIICRANQAEIPAMWTWARERGITPYFEVLTDQGRARQHPDLTPSSQDIREVFERLAAIDRERFGVSWVPRPPIAGFTCRRHLYSCVVTCQGFVQPCPGVDMSVGNVREKPLDVILRESCVVRDLRRVYQHIDPACQACRFAGACYGCRGNAYQATGNYLAVDPGCWLQQSNDTRAPRNGDGGE
jgi:radical SAM protein with 4Fe4S-binding SPASM domain